MKIYFVFKNILLYLCKQNNKNYYYELFRKFKIKRKQKIHW